jgi:hypothetical protein
MSLPVLFHWTVVPGFMQKRELPLAFGMLGVAEAALAERFTSTAHGLDAEPQVFSAVHICAETDAEQAYGLLLDWAVAQVDNTTIGNNSEVHLNSKRRFLVIVRLIRWTPTAPWTDAVDGRFTDFNLLR